MASLRCAGARQASAAATFLNVLASSTSYSPSLRALDFLLPTPVAPALRGRSLILQPRLTRLESARLQSRNFGTSRPRSRTVVARNNQKDEDGNDMLLEITPRAATRLSEIMAKEANPDLALRVQVESGGCHGFQYLMSLSSAAPDTVREDDTIFAYIDEAGRRDAGNQGLKVDDSVPLDTPGKPKVVLDTPSLELLKGSKVDFTMELIGSQFKIVDNPLATSSCGCGTSFDIKL